MQTINISDFRANLLKYLEIAGAGEQISITSNGWLLATVTAPAQLGSPTAYNALVKWVNPNGQEESYETYAAL